MPGRTLFNLPSTGTGEPDQRIDRLEQGVQKLVQLLERAADVGGKWRVVRIKVNAAVQAWDFVLANPTAGAFQILIPHPTECAGAHILIKNDSTSTSAITVKPLDAGTIDGATTRYMNAARGWIWLVSDGYDWKVMLAAGSETLTPATLSGAANTLSLNELNKYIGVSHSSATNLTVPANATVAFALGTSIPFYQAGAGQVTVVAAGGVTIRTAETLKLRKQYAGAVITKIGTDEWILTGDLELA